MTAQIREEMIIEHLDLVKYIVSRLALELPGCVDRDDLYSTGVLGLIKAVDRFDSSRGVKFETYASCLVRGEIMESLRETDPASRSLRRRNREMTRTAQDLSTQLRRPARAEEIAEAMGITLQQYQETVRQLQNATVISLEESVENDPQVEARALTPEGYDASSHSDPAAAIERQDLLTLVSANLERLPEREQAVLALYYGESLTLREIGALFGITESRVCQLHAQALRRLRRSVCEELEIAA